jgi:outer membrane protein assembly factor BamB
MLRALRSWWTPAIVLLLAGIAGIAVWSLPVPREFTMRLQATGSIVTMAGMALAGWWLLLGPAGWRRRLLLLVLAVLPIAITPFVLRIEVDGDVIPRRLAWAWSPGADRQPDELATTVTTPAIGLPRVDCPGFLGAAHDGVVTGVTLDPDWSARPPRICWQRSVGAAWSGFAVAGEDAVTMEQYGAEEVVACYALADGTLRWRHLYPARYATTLGGTGPRATPAIAADAVYSVGATGELRCLDRRDGALRWRHALLAEEGAAAPEWGVSASPLLVGDTVVVIAGGPDGRSVVAYDRATGARRWAAGVDPAGYASPVLARLHDRAVVLAFTHTALAVHDAAVGTLLVRQPWPGRGPKAAQPLAIAPDRVVAASGYGGGTTACRLPASGGEPVELWRSGDLLSKFSNLVHRDGFLYGLSDGRLVCLDAATGAAVWRGARYGHGQIFLVGDHLLISAEKDAAAVLVAAAPAGVREVARFPVFDATMTNPPCFAPPYLLLRTVRQAACVEVPLAAPVP